MSGNDHIIKDDLPKDLMAIIAKARNNSGRVGVHSEPALMEELVIYITARDHKVFDHAFKLGKEAKQNGK